MLHHWECRRCTNQWETCCGGHFFDSPDEKDKHRRQSASWLCYTCYNKLESGEIRGSEIFELYFYLARKNDKYGASKTWKVINRGTEKSPFYDYINLSTMCHPYKDTFDEDGKKTMFGNFETGTTAEHKQLSEITGEIREIYLDIIQSQRTAKRIELDVYQKEQGYMFFGKQPRPEGFVGDSNE